MISHCMCDEFTPSLDSYFKLFSSIGRSLSTNHTYQEKWGYGYWDWDRDTKQIRLYNKMNKLMAIINKQINTVTTNCGYEVGDAIRVPIMEFPRNYATYFF